VLPLQSGVLRIEADADHTRTSRELEFAVSDFLEMKLVCRIATRVAQLSASTKSPVALRFTEVRFDGDDEKPIAAQAIGMPLIVERTRGSALFLLEKVPESGVIFAQQEGLQPFSLHLNVEKLDDDSLLEPALEPATPLTVFIPLS
jgi:hypothetical protein